MTEQNPQVSVAVITYNMERYLEQLLDSILKQKVDFQYEIVMTVAMGVPGKNRSKDYPENLLTPYKAVYRENNRYCRQKAEVA